MKIKEMLKLCKSSKCEDFVENHLCSYYNVDLKDYTEFGCWKYTTKLDVEFPPGILKHPRRIFEVDKDATVGEFEDELAMQFSVEKGKWRLYRLVGENSELLDRNSKIENYCKDRLCFYPEF